DDVHAPHGAARRRVEQQGVLLAEDPAPLDPHAVAARAQRDRLRIREIRVVGAVERVLDRDVAHDDVVGVDRHGRAVLHERHADAREIALAQPERDRDVAGVARARDDLERLGPRRHDDLLDVDARRDDDARDARQIDRHLQRRQVGVAGADGDRAPPRRHHPFTEPMRAPFTKKRWMKGYTTSMGSVATKMTAIFTDCAGGTTSTDASLALRPLATMTIWRSSTWIGHFVESLM